MIKTVILGLAFFCLSYISASAHKLTDERCMPISKLILVSSIRHTPLSSPAQDALVSRATSSGLYRTAYEEYANLLKNNPSSSRANYLLGTLAYDYYMIESMRNGLSAGDLLIIKLSHTMQKCLKKSVELDSKSARAKSMWGFYLWQFGHRFAEGMALLREAVKIAPEDPFVHMKLGDIYSNASGKDYDVSKAEQELDRAIDLDPQYIPPHFILQYLYLGLMRHEEAKREEKAWRELLPPAADPNRIIHIY